MIVNLLGNVEYISSVECVSSQLCLITTVRIHNQDKESLWNVRNSCYSTNNFSNVKETFGEKLPDIYYNYTESMCFGNGDDTTVPPSFEIWLVPETTVDVNLLQNVFHVSEWDGNNLYWFSIPHRAMEGYTLCSYNRKKTL